LLSQSSFVSEEVSASATLLLQFLLLQQSNSLSSFISERASTSSRHQFELMSSDLQVLDELSDSDELDSLNPSASAVGSLNSSASAAASHYNLCSHSVVDKSDTHVSYVYVVISIDDIVKLITYKQAVKLPLCDK